jgi:hypothetical protein
VAEDQARLWDQPDPVPVALPGVPVAPADATGLRLRDDLVGTAVGPVDRLQFERFSHVLEHYCVHRYHLTLQTYKHI